MITVLAGLAVLLMAGAIAVVGLLAGRDDEVCSTPFGYPGMHADGAITPWGRP